MTDQNQRWADGLFALIGSSRAGSTKGVETIGANRMAEDMIIIHNLIIRIINTVYLQCLNVEKSPLDAQDFVSYSMEWGKRFKEHHHTEETGSLPPRSRRWAGVPGLMQANVARHEAFIGGLHAYTEYLGQRAEGGKRRTAG